jgi:hypothetical protein
MLVEHAVVAAAVLTTKEPERHHGVSDAQSRERELGQPLWQMRIESTTGRGR